MLTKHKVLCAKFLETHFDDVSGKSGERQHDGGGGLPHSRRSLLAFYLLTCACCLCSMFSPSFFSFFLRFVDAQFCKKYNVLLQSRNYVTKRQSLKLLGELLLNRSNFSIMMRYINSSENLKIMMNLLRGQSSRPPSLVAPEPAFVRVPLAPVALLTLSVLSLSLYVHHVCTGNTKAIQFEAFHVFKIFVANPKKSPGIVEILSRNKRKLIEFLQKFQKDKENNDEQFNEEKNTLLNTLNQLEDLSGDPPGAAPSSSHTNTSSSYTGGESSSGVQFNDAAPTPAAAASSSS